MATTVTQAERESSPHLTARYLELVTSVYRNMRANAARGHGLAVGQLAPEVERERVIDAVLADMPLLLSPAAVALTSTGMHRPGKRIPTIADEIDPNLPPFVAAGSPEDTGHFDDGAGGVVFATWFLVVRRHALQILAGVMSSAGVTADIMALRSQVCRTHTARISQRIHRGSSQPGIERQSKRRQTNHGQTNRGQTNHRQSNWARTAEPLTGDELRQQLDAETVAEEARTRQQRQQYAEDVAREDKLAASARRSARQRHRRMQARHPGYTADDVMQPANAPVELHAVNAMNALHALGEMATIGAIGIIDTIGTSALDESAIQATLGSGLS